MKECTDIIVVFPSVWLPELIEKWWKCLQKIKLTELSSVKLILQPIHVAGCLLIYFLLTHSLTHSFTYSLTHSFTYSPTHSLTHSCSRSLALTLIHSSTLTHSHTRSLALTLIHSSTHSLSPWSRVLREKLTGSQLVRKFPAFYGTQRFITAFTSAHLLSLFWVDGYICMCKCDVWLLYEDVHNLFHIFLIHIYCFVWNY